MSFFMLLSILIIITLNSLINCLLPFTLALFLEISPVLLFGARFFISLFWLPLCVFFYVSESLLWLTVFMGWSYIVGILWGLDLQSP